jgi:predicted O-methyltransferase YrrM
MSAIDALLLLITTAGLATSIVALRKVKKIHLATYDLTSAAKETRALFSQLQALSVLERSLALDKPLPLLRGWAGSPDFLLTVSMAIKENRPNVVMECSSGASTLVIARSLQLNGQGHVYSLEHDPVYAAKTNKLLLEHALSSWATVIHAPLETKRTETPWYSEDVIPTDLQAIDLLVIDGPPSTIAPMARFPALPRLIGRMSKHAKVIIDDTARTDDSKMIQLWLKSFPHITARDGSCEKGCMLLQLND